MSTTTSRWLLVGVACLGIAASTQDAPAGSSSPAARAAYAQAQTAVAREDYRKAIGLLERIVKAEPRNADALNLLGYSHRKLGDAPRALDYYEKALAAEPAHRGALEYLGELHVEQGRLDDAKKLLARLQAACPEGCEEARDLEAAIAAGKPTP
jgi:Flp pilus assembly protein TadD